MREIGRHIQQIAGFQGSRHARQGKLARAGQNLNQRVLGGGVFRQFLACRETEQHRARIGGAQQGAADNAVGRVLGFGGQRQDFFAPGINERLFIHASNLTAGQGSCKHWTGVKRRQAAALQSISVYEGEPSSLPSGGFPSAPPPSKSIRMSRGSAPLLGPTMPRCSNSSMMRAARV